IKALTDDASKFGQVFDQAGLDQGKELGLATRQATQAFQGFEIELARGVVPVLTQTFGLMSDGIAGVEKLTKSVGGLAGVADFGIHSIPVLGSAVDLLQGHFKDAALHATGLGTILGHLGGLFGDDSKKVDKDKASHIDYARRLAETGQNINEVADALDGEGLGLDQQSKKVQAHEQKMADLGAQVGLTGQQISELTGNSEKSAQAFAKQEGGVPYAV
ncbi:MAG: hypothetical protein M3066_00805, partial [Actinomycetota bacterium]|nr:hypothetical protein [Actinomycetota bacterium]